MRDPFWKRSAFGSLVMFVGILVIRWAVDGVTPTSDQWIESLGLALTLLGFQTFRPTTRA